VTCRPCRPDKSRSSRQDLDLHALGFAGVVPETTGRPGGAAEETRTKPYSIKCSGKFPPPRSRPKSHGCCLSRVARSLRKLRCAANAACEITLETAISSDDYWHNRYVYLSNLLTRRFVVSGGYQPKALPVCYVVTLSIGIQKFHILLLDGFSNLDLKRKRSLLTTD
jgi:hypothetical protein